MIKKLFNGEYPLWKTYWLFGGLAMTLLNFVLGSFSRVIAAQFAGEARFVAAGLAWTSLTNSLMLGYMGILTAGVFRAGKRYQGSIVWVWLSRAAIIAGLVMTVSGFLQITRMMAAGGSLSLSLHGLAALAVLCLFWRACQR